MTLTLWRGNDLLGELHVRRLQCGPTGMPSTFTALVVRAAGAPSCEPLFQAVTAGLVVQHGMSPDRIVRSRPVDDPAQQSFGCIELQPVSPEDQLPPEKQLTIRDGAGNAYLPALLIFDEYLEAVFAEGAEGPGFAMAPRVTIATIVEGIQVQSDEVDSYLHRATARVVTVRRDTLEAADNGDHESTSSEELRSAREILQSEGEYLALPNRFEVDANRVAKQLGDAEEWYRDAAREWGAANHVELL